MARRKRKKHHPQQQAWLITFSDMMTLLLTFFVLLLSMSSMDKTILTRVNIFTNELGFMTYRGAGRIPTRIKLLIELLENPWDILEKQNRFKDLLFPDDVLPPEIDRSTLEQNLQILLRPEGVALVLSDNLLFRPGSSELTEPAKALLEQVYLVLSYMTADINISGHTDSSGFSGGNYRLSAERALATLEYFTGRELRKDRFSASAYGPDRPIAPNTSEEGRASNRRVEILVKTNKQIGGY